MSTVKKDGHKMKTNKNTNSEKTMACPIMLQAVAKYRKSKFACNDSIVYVSDNMSGKMSGFPSISTSVALNPICQARAKDPNSICAHCFAQATVNRYTALAKNLEYNTRVLTACVLPLETLPRFTYAVNMCRFESFGDLNNVIQVINYFNIAKVNKHVHFALWSKNPKLIALAIEQGNAKPENLNIIYSSPILNTESSDVFARYPFIDKVFTVYDKQTIAKENITINCGARACAGCGLCYFDKTIKEVREQLK